MPADLLRRQRIVDTARRYVGTPFRHQGRGAGGLDCVGLLIAIARDLGLPHPDVTGYTRRAEGMGFLSHFQRQLQEIPLSEAGPGDVLVFVETVYPCHTGLCSERHGAPHLIHAHAPRRLVIEEPFEGVWRQKLRFAFRFPNLVED